MKKREMIDLHTQSMQELTKLLRDTRTTQAVMVLEHSVHKLKNTRALFHGRKDIARIATALHTKKEETK